MSEEKKKRGRPPLPPEVKAERVAQRNAYKSAYHKRTQYAAQKKYKATHPEVYRGKYYEPKIRVPLDKKESLVSLMERTGLTITQLFIGAVEEKYGVILHNPVDKTDK